MRASRWVTIAVAAVALIGLITAGGPATVAQDATPQAEQGQLARPAHIHVDDCANIGDIVAPLNDLTAPGGERVGVRRAFEAESSFTNVPMTIDQMLASDHSLNVHMSADQLNVYIACGDIGGALTPDGALIIGLAEQNNSGYTGIAYLSPGADGVSTDVSVFIAPVVGGGRGSGNQTQTAGTTEAPQTSATTETPAAAGTPAAAEAPATTTETETPTGGESAMGTPTAGNGDASMVAGGQVPVSLAEFAISMPTSLPAGRVTFAVTNDGTIAHSFEIEGNGVEKALKNPLEPGQTDMLSVNLDPGTYTVYCPIDDHRGQGMELEVTVS
jgi:uncharacterized cupredoxin-like copper-binding protein